MRTTWRFIGLWDIETRRSDAQKRMKATFRGFHLTNFDFTHSAQHGFLAVVACVEMLMLPAQAPSASLEAGQAAAAAAEHSVASAQHDTSDTVVAAALWQHEPSDVVKPAASVTALRPGMLPVLAYTPTRVTRIAAAIPARIFVVIPDTPIEKDHCTTE